MNNILFICAANKERSRTAEIHFSNKYPERRFRSAGINKYLCEKHGGIHLKQYMLDTAEKIICMEECHKNYIAKHFDAKYLNKVEVIHLGDVGNYMTSELIERLEEKWQI